MKNKRLRYSKEELRLIRSKVMTMASALIKSNNYHRSRAVRIAWKMVKQLFQTKVVGVFFGKRQKALRNLLKYDPRRIKISLVHEPTNSHDPNAVAVIVTVTGKGSYQLGYIKKPYSPIYSSLLKKGYALSAQYKNVTGGVNDAYYGLNISFMIDEAACTRNLINA